MGRHYGNGTLNGIVIRGGGTHAFTDIFLGAGYYVGPNSPQNIHAAGITILNGEQPVSEIVFTNVGFEGFKAMSPCIDIRQGTQLTFINANMTGGIDTGSFGVLIGQGVAFVRFIGGKIYTATDGNQNIYIQSGSTPSTQTSDIFFDGVQIDKNLPFAEIGISAPAKRVRMDLTFGNQTSGLARFNRISGVIESLVVDAGGVAHVAAADVWRVAASSFIKYLYDGYEGQVIRLLLGSNVSFWQLGNVALSSPLPGTFTSGTLSLIYDTTPADPPNTGTWRELSRAITI
jgi:hypothetical protein